MRWPPWRAVTRRPPLRNADVRVIGPHGHAVPVAYQRIPLRRGWVAVAHVSALGLSDTIRIYVATPPHGVVLRITP